MSAPHSMERSIESMFYSNNQYDDDRSSGGGSIERHSHGQYEDEHSIGGSSVGRSNEGAISTEHDGGNFMTEQGFNDNSSAADEHNLVTNSKGSSQSNHHPNGSEMGNPLSSEAERNVSKEGQILYKENAARLSAILEKIKNSTKNVLNEMSVYLQETEKVEITYIRCRANTQKESQRLEQVEPDVAGATQRFLLEAQNQLFGANGATSMAPLLKHSSISMQGALGSSNADSMQ